MSGIRAKVKEGRLLVDEPTSLPEGTVLELVLDDEGDDLTENEREALYAALANAGSRRRRVTCDLLEPSSVKSAPAPSDIQSRHHSRGGRADTG